MTKLLENIDDLSSEQQLQLIEELWESLSEKSDAIRLTNAQREELDRRLDDLESDGLVGIPWDEVLRKIRKRDA